MRINRQKKIDIINPLTIAALFALALVLGFSPLLGTPGPESAFIFGVVASPLLFFGSVRRGAQHHERGFDGDLGLQILVLGLALGLFSFVIWIRGLSSHPCMGNRSLSYLLFLTGPMLLLHCGLGVLLGRAVKKIWLGYVLGGTFFLCWSVYAFSQWYALPTFRFASQFFGVLTGDLFRGLKSPDALYPFKGATLGYFCCVVAIGRSFYPKTLRGSLSGISQNQQRFKWWIAPLFLFSFWLDLDATSQMLPSRAQMEDTYSLNVSHNGITVHGNPQKTTLKQVEVVLAEANLWQSRVQSRLQIPQQEEIHVWLHATDRDRGYWTGAYHVDFALPWRHELHVAEVDIPHRSLGHELVHVMAASMNDTLFRVPSQFGFWVNSGITEGLAMAVTPELTVKSGLTLKQQAAGMLRAGYKLNAEELMSASGFWRQSPARAYTLSGAFVEWLLQRKPLKRGGATGLEIVQSLYRNNDLSEVKEASPTLSVLVEEFQKELSHLVLPDFALGFAQKRFSRSSILQETCDPKKEETIKAVKRALSADELEKAHTLARAYEPELSHETHFLFAKELAKHKNWKAAVNSAVESARHLPVKATFEKGLRWMYAGDLAHLSGDKARAHILWMRAMQTPMPPSWKRNITAKTLMSQSIQAHSSENGLAQAGLEYLLLPQAGKSDAMLALVKLEKALDKVTTTAADESTIAALLRYLIARQFVQRGGYDEGVLMMLDLSQNSQDELPSVFYDEILKGLAEAHLRRGDFRIGKRGYENLLEQEKRPAQRILYQDKIERAAQADLAVRNHGLLGGDVPTGY